VAESETPRGTLGTVHNAAFLLTLLSDGPPHHALTDLAERSGMSLPTLHRLLRSLVAAGLVEQDPSSSRYGLGPQLPRLAERYLERLPVTTAATPYLVDLRATTGATVTLVTLAGTDAVLADRIDGEDVGGVHRDAVRVRPALETAAGRLLLAHADEERWQAATVATEDGPGPADRDGWRDTEVLRYVPPAPASRPEIATVVRAGDRVVAAVGLAGPASQLSDDAIDRLLGPHLLRAAASISRALGHA
jgi:IclR family transcriptional regulator, acetate operon repressor